MKTSFAKSSSTARERSRCRLLLVDDNPVARDQYVSLLGGEGYVVEAAEDGAAALERLADTPFDLIVTDRYMPNLDGASMILALRSAGLRTPVVMISRSVAHTPLPEAVAREVSAVLPKPVVPGEVSWTIARVLESFRLGNPTYQTPADSTSLPPLVGIILEQALRHRGRGAISARTLERQLRRIVREELEPRGLELQKCRRPAGKLCLLVRVKLTGSMLMDVNGDAPENSAHGSPKR